MNEMDGMGWGNPGAPRAAISRSTLASTPSARWSSEARFFDRIAEKLAKDLRPTDPLTVARYARPRRPWYNKERRFQLLGDLRGRRVLDVGCGEGSNAVLMARFGAEVLGIDVSPGSIALCQRRAELDGVAQRTRFTCAPLDTVELPPGSFDVIWGDGVLHHLIPELDTVMEKLTGWAKPGALFVFSEPVCLSPWLRRLRMNLPIHTDATPDERPLEAPELALLRAHLPGLRMRWFSMLSRLDRYVLVQRNYERSPRPRRLLSDLLGLIDRAVLSVPVLQPLGSMCVIYGRTHSPSAPPH
ncbi:class I SAM-dependent methyltransferase [Corallococcus carmarthensis]|uniref:class I SAM-dependent methyltransferase n=1 Tax=Corallococcus carmarthensis TaxID=2316728 RepID=UPI001C0FBA36|nr:class I SAM-dependent methyltransferase [Corallococcus carmarthensis]